jgi:ABC-type uncharacterized transport system permease subunit
MRAGAEERVKTLGVTAALIAAPTSRLLDRIAEIENDFSLPRGVESRRRKEAKYSYYWVSGATPANIDRHVQYARTGGFPITPKISENGWLANIPGTTVHYGLVVAVLLIAVYAVVMSRSKWGYEVRAIGESPSAAKYAGMKVNLQMLAVMAISGALAGLAGMGEVAGNAHRLEIGVANNYGFTAVIVAWLAQLSPLGIVAMSIFMAALLVGGLYVKLMSVPDSVAMLLQGIILFSVLGCDLLSRYRIRWNKRTAIEEGIK